MLQIYVEYSFFLQIQTERYESSAVIIVNIIEGAKKTTLALNACKRTVGYDQRFGAITNR